MGMLRFMMYETDDAAGLALAKVREYKSHMRLKSLVARNPRTGAIMFTAPVLTDAGLHYLVEAARDAGWLPLYAVTARPRR